VRHRCRSGRCSRMGWWPHHNRWTSGSLLTRCHRLCVHMPAIIITNVKAEPKCVVVA
jgi:hypothetical protein